MPIKSKYNMDHFLHRAGRRSASGYKLKLSVLRRRFASPAAALGLLSALAACSGERVDARRRRRRSVGIRDAAGIGRAHPIDKIQHIVIVIQENRSFNNLFYGFPGAKTVTFGYDSKNQKIALKPIGLSTNWDVEHNHLGFEAACNGTGSIPGTDCQMNGFDKETWQCGQPSFSKCPIKYPPYSYVPHSDTAPYSRWASSTF